MRKEYVIDKLREIENESDRPEILQIYEKVLLQISKYQEESLHSMASAIKRQLSTERRNYAIKTYLSTFDKYQSYSEQLTVLKSTGYIENIVWGQGAIKTIWYTKRDSIEGRVFDAYAITNYEKYPVKVIIKKNNIASYFGERMDKLYSLHSIDCPKVNQAYMRRFFDVCFESVEDKLREDEYLMELKVDWADIEADVLEDLVLLWNVKPRVYVERSIPFNNDNMTVYGHELVVDSITNGILLDIDSDETIDYDDMGEKIVFYTREREYKAHRTYEICQVLPYISERLGMEVSNELDNSYITSMQKSSRHLTEGELYRRVSQYQIADYFHHFEVSDSYEIIFYVEDDPYEFAEEMMEYIIEDLNLLYCTDRFRGRLRQCQ